ADALPQIPGVEIIVNLQGEAPLTPPWFVEPLIDAKQADPTHARATPVLRCEPDTLQSFLDDRRAGRVGGTTAVFDRTGRALYFSKNVLPYLPQYDISAPCPVFHHVGVYAYRRDVLAAYPTWPPGPLERMEGLEQLRFLENGQAIQCVEVEARETGFWEVNNPEDVPRVEAMLAARGLE
ncbi:MAG: 3-deoxy-manno-octulosonate cytidylyltransferase, partial [Pseudomonadota bacterium]